jgi:purine-cytosine permease-like protein
MKKVKGYLISIVYILIGAVLIGLAFAGKVDSFWNGMGSGLLVIGGIQWVRFYRFNKNEAYREKLETEANDERNKFISNKAWAWAGYLFVMISAIGSIVLKIFGQDLLSIAAGGAVLLIVLLYWIAYAILRRKY